MTIVEMKEQIRRVEIEDGTAEACKSQEMEVSSEHDQRESER